MTFAEYIAQQRPHVALLPWQRAWVGAIDAVLSSPLKRPAAGHGFMLSLLRDYMRFTRG